MKSNFSGKFHSNSNGRNLHKVTEIGLGFYIKMSAGRYEEIVNEEIEGAPGAS